MGGTLGYPREGVGEDTLKHTNTARQYATQTGKGFEYFCCSTIYNLDWRRLLT